MTLLQDLSCESCWKSFLEYKESLAAKSGQAEELRKFIEERRYEAVKSAVDAGAEFPLAKRVVLSKMGSQKKRTVYIYPRDENMALKLLTFLILRKYDGLFSGGLYSFRPRLTAKDAVRKLVGTPGIRSMSAYKVDISNYFNSIPVESFLPMLKDALSDDPQLYGFLSSLLLEKRVLDGTARIGRAELPVITEEQKGIMAGTPQSSFYANLYLMDLDRHFEELGVPYARYSDDIIVFGRTEEETKAHAEFIRGFLAEKGLSVNPSKEVFSKAGEPWTFLGFLYDGGSIDIAPATLKKLKGKMRRKARSLRRWAERNGVEGERAAKAFIRIFNRKLLESPEGSELSWSYWFFSVINTVKSLHEIDSYAQDCIRFIVTGLRTKARFNVRYEDLKALGYRSLVHEYWEGQKQ